MWAFGALPQSVGRGLSLFSFATYRLMEGFVFSDRESTTTHRVLLDEYILEALVEVQPAAVHYE